MSWSLSELPSRKDGSSFVVYIPRMLCNGDSLVEYQYLKIMVIMFISIIYLITDQHGVIIRTTYENWLMLFEINSQPYKKNLKLSNETYYVI